MWTDAVINEILVVAGVAFVVAPLLGVAVARLRGPLTWTRGLIGAVSIPIAWSVWNQVMIHAGRPSRAPAVGAQHVSSGRYYAVAFTVSWIVEAALVGAIATALWRALDRRRGRL